MVSKDTVPSEWVVQMNGSVFQPLCGAGFVLVSLKLGSQTSVMLTSPAHCMRYGVIFGSFAIANLHTWLKMPAHRREWCILISMLLLNAALAWNAAMNDVSLAARVRALHFHHLVWKFFPMVGYVRNKHLMISLGWSCAMDILAHWLAQFNHGDPFNISTVLWFGVSSVFYGFFGFLNQARLANLHHKEEVVKSQSAALEKLLSMLCDGIAWIADDDATTIMKTAGRRELFMAGTADLDKLSDLLGNNTDEVHRLHRAFHQSKTSPILFHAICSSSDGEPFSMKFFIVRQESVFSFEQTSCLSCCHGFLVGVCKQNVLACPTGDCNLDGIKGSDMASNEPFQPCQISAEPTVTTHLDDTQPEDCTPVSTKTGELFRSIENMGDTAENMEKLVKLGHQEHWLVKSHELHVDPCHRLGNGAFGVVMAGSFHGTDVAIKLPNVRSLPKAMRSFINEIRILRHIRHPNVVLFHGVCVADSNSALALVFERVHGTSLKSFIKAPSPGPSALQRHRLVLDVCEALRYLHGQDPQVVHGDVKADNIMVDNIIFAEPRAKMLDFGLSRLVTKSAHQLGGTLLWMAPEAIAGSHPHTAADVFSFGRLLSFTMSGQTPYPGMSERQIRIMASSGQAYIMVPPGSFFEKDCESLCAACCAFMSKLRPTMTAVHNMVLAWTPSSTEEEAVCAMPCSSQSLQHGAAMTKKALAL